MINVKSTTIREATGSKKKNPFYKQRGFHLFLMILPFIVLVFMLSYLPLFGWSYAFFNFRPGQPLTMDRFVGFHHFTSMFMDPFVFEDIVRVLQNTFAMSLLGIAGSPLPLIFAMFLAEIKFSSVKRIVQTVTTIPNFISWVLIYAVAFSMFSVGDGFVNRLLISLGVIDSGINFLASPNNVWITMWGYSTWRSLGWGAIIYFAAIAGIDQEQYDAAKVDGAGRFSIMRHITLPGLMPTYFVLLILSIANFLNNGMEQFFVFQNPMNRARIEVLDLFVFNQGMASIHVSFATAVGIFRSLVSIVLLFVANGLSKIFRDETIF